MDFLKTLKSEHFKTLSDTLKMNTIDLFIVENSIVKLKNISNEYDKKKNLFDHYIEMSNKYIDVIKSLSRMYVFFNHIKSQRILNVANSYTKMAECEKAKMSNTVNLFKNNYTSLKRTKAPYKRL